jgi:hypothetical protein
MYITQWALSVRGELANLSNIEQVEEVETGGAAAFGRRIGTKNQSASRSFRNEVGSVGVLSRGTSTPL